MKFTLSWLSDHLDFFDGNDDISVISKTLTSLGLEVESVFDPSEKLKDFKVGCITEHSKHPNADKLSICKVDVGDQEMDIICGANNLSNGMKVVFAPVGIVIPESNEKLKKAKIRGIPSNGMLCSERELCISDEHDGIIELDKKAIIGSEASLYLDGLDPVFEIAITPNRQDCLGVRGIARDLSAKGLGKLKDRKIDKINGSFQSPINVNINDNAKDDCFVFFGRYLKNVKNVESPKWLRNRLISIGLKPISALVDITNYITFDLARPLHVFDAKKINGDLAVKNSLKDEKILALNDKIYNLDSCTTIIADEKAPVSIAGIIGGKESGAAIETQDIFIESALFNPISVAKSGRKYGIESDARYRFERGVDPNSAEGGIELATKLIMEICGGVPSSLVKAGEVRSINKKISIIPEKLNKYLGIEINRALAVEILNNLGFGTHEENSEIKIEVPSWRSDVFGEADIIEEIARIHGYDKIPIINFRGKSKVKNSEIHNTLQLRNKARKILVSRGLNECITWSFMSSKYAKHFSEDQINLLNPISKDLDVLRPSIVPNLIEAVRKNYVRGLDQLSFFEIGPIFHEKFSSKQLSVLTLARAGVKHHRSWKTNKSEFSVFDIKADVLSLLRFFNIEIDKLPIYQEQVKWLHPGRSAIIKNDKGNDIASFGEVHPLILREMNLECPVFVADIYIDNLASNSISLSRESFLSSDFPSVIRDFSFVVDKNISAQEITLPLKKSNIYEIKEVNVFDVYNDKLDKNKKSIAISIILEPSKKTFTDSEIEKICKKIIKIVNRSSGAELRN
ncbi:MAG: phenylalanine--tRNA ligase subunit beta [Rhodospirillaceae bacterium]|nr:phenylalanine--tRNA ligase subunit beta [Rhodospirillaceae bacterium]